MLLGLVIYMRSVLSLVVSLCHMVDKGERLMVWLLLLLLLNSLSSCILLCSTLSMPESMACIDFVSRL